MRRYSMSDHNALTKIHPRNRSDWRQLGTVSAYLLLIVIFVVTTFFVRHTHRQDIEANWQSTTADIEEVRSQPAWLSESAYGGVMLYDVQVLVSYDLHGARQERWVKVQQQPRPLAEAKLQTFRWKSKTCRVHWKISSPDQVIVDVS